MRQRYLEDFAIGEVFTSKSQTLSAKHFEAFAQMTGDSHPIHYDASYARSKGWPAPLAHGLLLLGICAIGASPISDELKDSMVAMLGNEARYKKPAILGDIVTPEFKVTEIESKGDDRGILRLAIALYNERRELILEGEHVVMLRKRKI